MRAGPLLIAALLCAPGCGDASAADPEASFATWLAALPEPVESSSFACTYSALADARGLGMNFKLRAGGIVVTDADGRLRVDCDLEVTPPDILPLGNGGPAREFRVGSQLYFDGELGRLQMRTDSGWIAGLASEAGLDLDANVMTLQADTLERLREGVLLAIRAQMESVGGLLGDGEPEAGKFGPGYWVFMVGRESEVLAFRDRGEAVQVDFGLQATELMADVMGAEAGELQLATTEIPPEFESISLELRMIFDKQTGFTRAVRLELDWTDPANAGNTAYARIDIGEISAEPPAAEQFRYVAGDRIAVPFDALLQPILAQLPEAADQDFDF